MKFIFSLVVLLFMSLSTFASDVISVHCPQGCPENPQGSTVIYRHVYALSNNPETKFANWVAYEISPENFGGATGRTFRGDPLLPRGETLEPADYKGAYASELKADKGHLAPVGAHGGSHHRHQLDYLSNIVPQHESLNRGVWKELEGKIKEAARYGDSLFAFAGPVYGKEMIRLPSADESHVVPSAFFKIVYDDSGGVAFLMEQDTSKGIPFCAKRVPLLEVGEALSFKLPNFKESALIADRLSCKA